MVSASIQKHILKQMGSGLCKLTDFLRIVADLNLPDPTRDLQQLYMSLFRISGTLIIKPREVSSSAQPARHLMVADFLALLTALVPQLDRLGSMLNSATACSIGCFEEGVFWDLWNVLTISNYAFSAAYEVWPNFLFQSGAAPVHVAVCCVPQPPHLAASIHAQPCVGGDGARERNQGEGC